MDFGKALAAVAMTGVVMTGCTTVNQPSGAGMMGDTSGGGGGTGGVGGGMMGSGPDGYHLSVVTCSAPTSLPGTRVDVMVGDMGMTQMMGGDAPLGQPMRLRAVPGQMPAGQVSFVVANSGWRTHELVVLPLDPGRGAGERVPATDGKVDEAASLGEVSGTCAEGAGEGIHAGSVGWATLTLPTGRYELVCNLRNHYANGMWQEFDVT